MKGSAVREQASSEAQDDQSAFQRFAKTMRALIAVPKHELDEKLAKTRRNNVIETSTTEE